MRSNQTINLCCKIVRLSWLSKRQEHVLTNRLMGFTLKEIGKTLGIGGARTRVVEEIALRKIRNRLRFSNFGKKYGE